MASIEKLKDRNRIFGPLPAIEEVISPTEERENENITVPNDDDQIIAPVHHERAVEQGDIIEVESEDRRVLSADDVALDVAQISRRFRAEVWQEYSQNMKQPTLVDMWGRSK